MLLTPRAYARSQRRWIGEIPLSNFQRLAEDFEDVSSSVTVNLSFRLDENDRVRIEGYAEVKGLFRCKQCLLFVENKLNAQIAACLLPPALASKEEGLRLLISLKMIFY